MPPKRKAPAATSDAPASSRTTRASKRKSTVAEDEVEETPVASTSKAKAPAKKSTSKKSKPTTTEISDSDLSALEDEPPKKKAKTTKAAPVKKAAAKKHVVEIEDDSESAEAPVKKAPAKKAPAKKAAPKPAAKSKKKKPEPVETIPDDTPEAEPIPELPDLAPEPEPVVEVDDTSPFTMKKLDKFYKTYADAENPEEISGEGLERMFNDLNVDMESIVPFILPFDLKASKMGSLTKEEFYRLQLSEVDSIPKLRKYLRAMTTDVETSSFDRFYDWLYPFCLEEGQKTMPMEMALPLWTIILKDKTAVAADFVHYIGTQAYKGVNKDAWQQVNEFIHEVTLGPETEGRKLVGFSEESAFPVIIDEYAEWVARGRVDKKEEED